jgi:hypothetical protein
LLERPDAVSELRDRLVDLATADDLTIVIEAMLDDPRDGASDLIDQSLSIISPTPSDDRLDEVLRAFRHCGLIVAAFIGSTPSCSRDLPGARDTRPRSWSGALPTVKRDCRRSFDLGSLDALLPTCVTCGHALRPVHLGAHQPLRYAHLHRTATRSQMDALAAWSRDLPVTSRERQASSS